MPTLSKWGEDRSKKFFRIIELISSEKTLISYYKTIFNMKRYGNFDLNEINNLYPYEMEIFTFQLIVAMEEEKKNEGKRK